MKSRHHARQLLYGVIQLASRHHLPSARSQPGRPPRPAVMAPAVATQTSSNTISGRVTDSAGNPVSGVTVTAYPNAATGAVKILKVTADHDLAGYYPVGLRRGGGPDHGER